MTTPLNSTTFNATLLENLTLSEGEEIFYPASLVIPITVVYGIIFVIGVVGNVSTCIIISYNKSMHTATNYYLFSLAVSDMLLLISALPPEMYRIWSPTTYIFGEAFCILQGLAAETSANATVLTITAFTVERYVAICHPFLSHTMSKLSRAIRYIIIIWILALCLAAPQAIQFRVIYETKKNGEQHSRCTVMPNFFEHVFEISTFVFFVGPMTLITVLYVLIGIQLRKSKGMAVARKESTRSSTSCEPGKARNSAAQNRVVKMLVAVVAAFFICWAPFHAQRLLAVYLSNASKEAQETTMTMYMVLMYVSGILYFLSTTINPVLYNIMSNRFREAFKKTFSDLFRRPPPRPPTQTYSVLSRCLPHSRQFQRSVSDGAERINEELNLKPTKSYHFLGCNRVKQDSSTIIDCKRLQPTVLSESKPTLITSLESTEKSVKGKKFRIFRLWGAKKKKGEFRRQSSAESNTISNSSLQDMDEMEYSSSDLVKYMEEINEDIA